MHSIWHIALKSFTSIVHVLWCGHDCSPLLWYEVLCWRKELQSVLHRCAEGCQERRAAGCCHQGYGPHRPGSHRQKGLYINIYFHVYSPSWTISYRQLHLSSVVSWDYLDVHSEIRQNFWFCHKISHKLHWNRVQTISCQHVCRKKCFLQLPRLRENINRRVVNRGVQCVRWLTALRRRIRGWFRWHYALPIVFFLIVAFLNSTNSYDSVSMCMHNNEDVLTHVSARKFLFFSGIPWGLMFFALMQYRAELSPTRAHNVRVGLITYLC